MVTDLKKIIIYISESEKKHAFGVFLDNLGNAFRQLGYEVIYIDMGNLNQVENAIKMLIRNEIEILKIFFVKRKSMM